MLEMLNRQFSSSPSPSLSSSSKNKKKKKKQSPRMPLKGLNTIVRSNSSISIRSSCSSSSVVSIDPPRGCLRFFLSNSSASKPKNPTPHRHKPLSKSAPKSALNPKPSSSSSSFRSRKPFKENLPKPTSQKEKPNKTPPFLYQWQSGKKPNSQTAPRPKPSTGLGTSGGNLASGSGESSQNLKVLEQKQCETGKPTKLINLPDMSTGVVEKSTPVGKLACGSVLGCGLDDSKFVEEDSNVIVATKTTTPPVVASVSPEIQCGPSSMLVSAGTPACYGAGHIVSGVKDRRKCRARGILAVGETESDCGKAKIFDNIDDVEVVSKSRMSLVPLPVEASMRWLLSPCGEKDEGQKSDPQNELLRLQKTVGSAVLRSVSPSPSGQGISSDILYNIFNSSSTISPISGRKTRINLLSPSGKPAFQGHSGGCSSQVAGCSTPVSPAATPTCEAVIPQENKKHRYHLAGENSPFSIDSLCSSGNVIQTPQSDSSSDRHVGLSWLNAHGRQNHDFGSEIDSVTEVLLRASLSPKTKISIWDQPGSSFQFSDLISPSSDSLDLTQLLNTWENCASCISNSALEDMSRSQMRISWRDGLTSRIFEMDEFDCCRCLSDDENDANECTNGKFKSSPSHELNVDVENLTAFSNDFGSTEVVGHEPKYDGERKEEFSPMRSNPCEESICTDGGGLVASGDSDWTLCFKNQLFEF